MGDIGAPDHDKCHVCGCSKEQYYTLKQRVEESKQRINLMESEFLQSTLYTENELDECREEYRLLQQKYNALEKSHQELHEINQDLEERILDVAAAYEKEKQALNREVLTLSQKLLDTKFEINKLEEKNTRYKKDCDLAVQLLQCTPSGAYMQHKVSQLPQDLQFYVHEIMGEINKGVYQPSATSPTETSHQPLLGGGNASVSNGLIAARTYHSVPAHVVARAMQRREEEERKEMEKLIPTTRKRKGGRDGSVMLHDKGTQTISRPTMNKKYSLLCVKCGLSMKDEDELALAEKEKEKEKEKGKQDTPKEEEKVERSDVKPESEQNLLVDVSIEEETVPPPVNLLDLTDTPPPRTAHPRGPSNTSLLLDLLEGPADDAPEADKAVQSQTLVDLSELSDLILGHPEEVPPEPADSPLSNATSPQEAATPADSGIFDDVMATSSATTHTSDSAASSDIASLEPEADAAMNVSRRSTPSKRLGSESDSSPQHKVNGNDIGSPALNYSSDTDSKSIDGQHDDAGSVPGSPVRLPTEKRVPKHPMIAPPAPPTSAPPVTSNGANVIVKPRINGQMAGGRPGKLACKEGPIKDKPRPLGGPAANQAAAIGRSKASYMQTSV